jgi:hypothetical protein
MLSLANKPFKLSVIMLNVVILNVVAPSASPINNFFPYFMSCQFKDLYHKTYYSRNSRILVIS